MRVVFPGNRNYRMETGSKAEMVLLIVLVASGEMRMGSRLDAQVQNLQFYRPARFAGQILGLHYARAEDLGRSPGMLAADGELFVQFWLKPDDKPLELVIDDQGDVDVIPEELRRFL